MCEQLPFYNQTGDFQKLARNELAITKFVNCSRSSFVWRKTVIEFIKIIIFRRKNMYILMMCASYLFIL